MEWHSSKPGKVGIQMSDLKETLVGIIGDEEKASKVASSLGEFMIPKPEYSKKVDQLSKELTDVRSELEKAKVSTMDKEQLIEHKIKEVQEKEKQLGVKLNRVDAETAFINAGLPKEVYSTLLDQAVSEDKEKTMNLVNGLVTVLKTQTESMVNKTKEDLLNKVKKPNPGDEDKQKEVKKIRVI